MALVNEHRRISSLKRTAFGIVVLPEEDKMLVELCGTAEKALRVLEFGFPGQYNRLHTDSDKKLRGERSAAESSILKAGMLDPGMQKQDVFGVLPVPMNMRLMASPQTYGSYNFGGGMYGPGPGWHNPSGYGNPNPGRSVHMIEGAAPAQAGLGSSYGTFPAQPPADWEVENQPRTPARVSPASLPHSGGSPPGRQNMPDVMTSPTPGGRPNLAPNDSQGAHPMAN